MKTFRKQRVGLICLLAIMVVAVMMVWFGANFNQAYAHANEQAAIDFSFYDEATGMRSKHIPMLNENFRDDSVLVTLKREHSTINNVFSAVQLENAISEVRTAGTKSSGIHIESDTRSIGDIIISQVEDLTHFTPIAEAQFHAEKRSFAQILEITLDEHGKENVLKAIEYFEKLPFVLAAEPVYNYLAEVDWAPNDVRYNEQWGFRGAQGIQAERAWEFTRGIANVRVGVMDAGFDVNHEDLAGNSLALAGGFVPAAGVNLDHGTHCAGIIGAVSNNRVTGSTVNAVAGVSQSTLINLNSANFVSGLTFARNNDIRVINASFRYIDDTNGMIDGVWPPAVQVVAHANAVRDFPGILIVSAGNSGNTRFANTDDTPQFPAGYGDARNYPNITNVISVGNITDTGARAAGSCFGLNSVHVYAPGNAILSTLPGNAYGNMSGTSMAAPHAAGVAALLLSVNNNLTPVQVRDAILNNADAITIQVRIADNNNNFLRWENQIVLRLNAHRAVASVAFRTSPRSGGVSADGFINGFTLPNNANITIPERLNGQSVVAIGASAFANCTQMSQISIPASVTSIGAGALSGCVGLTSVTLPFLGGSLTNATSARLSYIFGNTVPPSLTTVAVLGGIIGDNAFFGCGGLTSIAIPGSTTSVGNFAFYGCAGLTSITIPNGVTDIGSGAFYGCVALQSADLPASVKSIGANAFYNTGIWDAADGAVYADGWVVGYNGDVTGIRTDAVGIADYAFRDCAGLRSITVPSGVKIIGAGAFYNCTALLSAALSGNGVTDIGSGAFYGCASLTGFTIPASVTSAGVDIFYGCAPGLSVRWSYNPVLSTVNLRAYLTEVAVPASVTHIWPYAFAGCVNLSGVTFEGSNVRTIGENAFGNCGALQDIGLPASLWTIEPLAFAGSGLRSIGIPADVTDIGNGAFADCTYLESVLFEGGALTAIGNEVFYNCYSLNEIDIPASVWSIGALAFYNCYSLGNFTLSENIAFVGAGAFADCDLSITWYYNSSLPSYNFNGYLAEIIFPYGLTSIGDYAFNGFTGLTSIDIPSTVTYIGWYAFAGTSLNTVELPQGLESIEDAAFADCYYLTDIEIPYSVTYIGDGGTARGCWAFANSDNLSVIWHYNPGLQGRFPTEYLKQVIIPDTVTSIAEYAFEGTMLTGIIIPDAVTSIGFGAFMNCTSLESITLPFVGHTKAGITDTHLGYIFGGDMHEIPQSLQTVTVTGGTLKQYAFSFLSLTVILEPGVEGINGGAFSYYYGSVIVPDSLITIDAYAFSSYYMMTVYTNAASLPAGWDGECYEDALVVWGCELSDDGTYMVSFLAGNCLGPWGEDWRDYELLEPRRAGFTFGGWALTAYDADLKAAAYTMETLWQATDGAALYAIWTEITG